MNLIGFYIYLSDISYCLSDFYKFPCFLFIRFKPLLEGVIAFS